MIGMDQYEYIRTAQRVYGKSIREIARETGHCRQTVRKVLKGEAPRYKEREHQAYPVLDPYVEIVGGWLEADKEVPKRQRHTARRIYHRLVEEQGFSGCESSVRRYVRYAKARLGLSGKEAYIPLDPECAQEAEVDWGRGMAIVAGVRMSARLFCMRPRFSGKDFVRAYPCERQEAFFDGHIHGFSYYGGVFRTLVYDNLKSAVLRVLKGKTREEQREFVTFRSYYTFKAVFCNSGCGHEKGGVEGLVGFARRNYLVPVPEVGSFDELNELLLRRCQARGAQRIAGRRATIDELFAEERQRLLCLPVHPYPNVKLTQARVSHYSTVTVDHNRYSVPTCYVGLWVSVERGIDQIAIMKDGKRIALHKRAYGKDKWVLDPFHYLELLSRKPGAFEAARPIRQWRTQWPEDLERLLTRFRKRQGESQGTKEFLCVLMLYQEHGKDEVNRVVKWALDLGLAEAASVKTLLESSREPSHCHADLTEAQLPARLRRNSGQWVQPVDVTVYNRLLTETSPVLEGIQPGWSCAPVGGIGHGN